MKAESTLVCQRYMATHVRGNDGLKQKREEKAASSRGAEKDPEPEDGAEARWRAVRGRERGRPAKTPLRRQQETSKSTSTASSRAWKELEVFLSAFRARLL